MTGRFAPEAGLRVGEVLGLIWEDVDNERGILRVERQYPQKTGHVPPEALPLPKYGRKRAVKLGTINVIVVKRAGIARTATWSWHGPAHGSSWATRGRATMGSGAAR